MRPRSSHSLLALTLLLAGCGAAAEPVFPADCAGLSSSSTVSCGEQRYWSALHVDGNGAVDARAPIYELLGRLAAGLPSTATDAERGRLMFLRGTLGMALALEDGQTELITKIAPDLQRAIELDPSAVKYPPWLHTMNLVTTYVSGDQAAFRAEAQAAVDSVDLYPVGNILSVGGTFSGFPLDSGLPQKGIELNERWICDADWCRHNTPRAPFSQPGLHYHFADAYARVGNREKALEHFRAALDAQDAARWPYRALAQHAVDDLDGVLATYAALGQDKHAIFVVYANSKQGCKLCHGN